MTTEKTKILYGVTLDFGGAIGLFQVYNEDEKSFSLGKTVTIDKETMRAHGMCFFRDYETAKQWLLASLELLLFHAENEAAKYKDAIKKWKERKEYGNA